MASSKSRGKWFWVQLGLIGLLTVKLVAAGVWLYLGPLSRDASAQEKKPAPAEQKEKAPAEGAGGQAKGVDGALKQPLSQAQMSKIQTDIIRQLKDREEQLNAREEDLNRRANELSSLQKKLEEKLAALEKVQQGIEAQRKKEDQEKAAQLVKLVKVYQNMKPGAAAAVMEKLDLATTVEILRNMRGREAGKIMANINPERASKITKLLSDKPRPDKAAGAKDKPQQ